MSDNNDNSGCAYVTGAIVLAAIIWWNWPQISENFKQGQEAKAAEAARSQRLEQKLDQIQSDVRRIDDMLQRQQWPMTSK